MNLKPLLIANPLLIALMLGVTAWFWQAVPESASVPLHWNFEGQPDRYGTKFEALLLLPALAAFITVMMWALPYFDPRRANIERSAKMWNAATIGIVALLGYLHVFLVLSATGMVIDIGNYLVPASAALFAVIGNYLSKTRSNWFAGVRTPWTMSSDYSWEMTHRLTGRLFVAAGVATFFLWLALDARTAGKVMLLSIVGIAVASVLMSYIFWKRDPARVSGAAKGEDD